MNGWGMLARELGRRRGRLAGLAGWSAVESLPALGSGWLVAQAADQGFLVGAPWIGAAWLGVFTAAKLVRALANRALLARLADIVEPVRDALVTRVVTGALAQAVHGRGRPDSAAVARLTEQVQSIRGLLGAVLLQVRRVVVAVLTAGVGLAAVSPLLAGLVLGPALVAVAAFCWLQRRLRARRAAVLVADEAITTDVSTVLDGLRDVVACGAQRRTGAALGAAVDAQTAATRRLAVAEAGRGLVVAAAQGLPLLTLLAALPFLIGSGQLGAGEALGAVVYVTTGLQPALAALLGTASGLWTQLGVILQRIASTSTAPEPPPAATGVPATATLRVESVGFAYGPHSLPVIDDLCLTVPAGEHLAVVGPSGVGKSTLVDLLTGLAEPDTGRVSLGGIPLDEIDPVARHRRIALLPQESYVFAGTVAENLTYLAPRASARAIDRAVDAIGAGELVRRHGYDGVLDPRTLSAADKQLIALVRVHLSAAEIVVLDEGTGQLDATAEARAELAFRRRPGTLIVVAHRMSSALRADRVLVLDGRGAAVGTHRQLIAHNPLYRELCGHWTSGSPARPVPWPRRAPVADERAARTIPLRMQQPAPAPPRANGHLVR